MKHMQTAVIRISSKRANDKGLSEALAATCAHSGKALAARAGSRPAWLPWHVHLGEGDGGRQFPGSSILPVPAYTTVRR